MKSKIYYALIVFVTFVIAATHSNEFPRFLFMFELLLAVVLYISAGWLEKRLSISMRPAAIAVKQLQELRVDVRLKNASRLPIPEIKIRLAYQDLLTGQINRVKGNAMLDGNGEAILSFRLDSVHCGAVSFWMEEASIVDYLGVFVRKCEFQQEKYEVTVLPDNELVLHEIELGLSGHRGFTEGISLAIHGDDPTEIYDIRKFQQGDALRSIHWKLSAKADDLLVKELGESLEMIPVIFLDLKHQEERVSRDQWDRFLAIVASFSRRTIQNSLDHYVAWFNSETAEVMRFFITNDETLEEMLTFLVRAKLYKTGEISEYYKETFGNEIQGETVQIDVSGKFIQ